MDGYSPAELAQIAAHYLAALERGDPFESISKFFTADCVQEEFPNRLVPNGACRSLADMQAAANRGAKAVEAQRFQILSTVAQGNHVALEVAWSAKVLLPFGSLKPGDSMTARFALFLQFRDGRIERQHNYDCFDPF
jgi:ketosteroid isomerase-like protein